MQFRSLVPFGDRGSLARPESNLFNTLQREVDRLFEDFTRTVGATGQQAGGNLVPRIDVSETDNEIEITAELPGLSREDVDIAVEDNALSIRGEKKIRDEKTGDGDQDNKNYHISERTYGVFYRVLELPGGIDPSSVQATMSNGVLKISIPKPARAEAKKIEVKEAA